MAGSTLASVAETIRQQLTQDTKFLGRYLMFFELRVPPGLLPTPETSFVFPIILPPESYSLDEPFSLELTRTLGGGLYTEEQGIYERTIRLRGQTGFRPRRLPKQPAALGAVTGASRSHARDLPTAVMDNISGHQHFMYLEDAVFRTYGDLKRDPATSEKTFLLFHVPKDDEHWLVKPRSFKLERSAAKPITYTYDIELAVVDRADRLDQDFSEEKSLLDTIKDVIRTVKAAIDLITGAITDVIGLIGVLATLIRNIVSIMDQVTQILDAVKAFVDATTDLIQLPYKLVTAAIIDMEAALQNLYDFEETHGEVQELPESTRQALRQIIDGLALLSLHPSAYESSAQAQMRQIRERQSLSMNVTTAELEAARAMSSPTTFEQVRAQGTGLSPGDPARMEADLFVGSPIPKFSSAKQLVIGKGDTLVSLAAQYLGDARQWQYLASLNGLKPPFADALATVDLTAEESPFSGSIGVGAKILIPNQTQAPASRPLLPVLGVPASEPHEVQLLGTDFALVEHPDTGMIDIPVDVEGGSTDAKLVSGVDNLSQALLTRLKIEKGTDILFKKLGLQRIVGMGIGPVDLELGRFRVIEAIRQDPRIGQVRDVTFEPLPDQPDDIEVNLKAEVLGFVDALSVRGAI